MSFQVPRIARSIGRLAWPVLVAQLAVIASGVLDTIMSGRYNAVDLAAVGIGASVYFSVFIGLMGVVLALSPIAARTRPCDTATSSFPATANARWLWSPSH